ncbi:hypothetical protein BX666DRAFT_251488 [Dichotomocladium elegans]|nr:hypothetical protein BX666DRAFT_251488 [Dichotomocladium elegans]
MMWVRDVFVFCACIIPQALAIAFRTRCWEELNRKRNLLTDGMCQRINQGQQGWQTNQADDWVYYPQQYGMR